MPGNDDGRTQRLEPSQRGDPVRERSLPSDRRALVEQDVAREQHALVPEEHHDIAGRVRRTDVEQFDRGAVEVQRRVAVDQGGRRRQLDSFEVESTQAVHEARERPELIVRRVAERHEQGGRGLTREVLGAEAMTDDLRTRVGEELVAPAMITVVVSVHDSSRR